MTIAARFRAADPWGKAMIVAFGCVGVGAITVAVGFLAWGLELQWLARVAFVLFAACWVVMAITVLRALLIFPREVRRSLKLWRERPRETGQRRD